MKKWTKEDLNRKGLKYKIQGKNTSKKNLIKISDEKIRKNLPKKISVEKQTIKSVLWMLQREEKIGKVVEELRFHPVRRWRFDWAIPQMKVAIEYEGIISAKSRHTTIKGFTGDTEKYNEAAKLGWKVLRYTALNYKNLKEDLNFLICR